MKKKIYRVFESELWYPKLKTKVLEHHPNAAFVAEIALLTKGKGWTANPGQVFYDPKPPKKEYAHFFAYYFYPLSKKLVVNGQPHFDPVVDALYEPTDFGAYLVWSRYAHDFVQSPVSDNAIDGGRDYCRILGNPELVRLNLFKRTFRRKGRTYHVEA